MHRITLGKAASISAVVALTLVLAGAVQSPAVAAGGFYYNPQNNTAGWNIGPYSTHYQWGPGWFRSDGTGLNGSGGNYYKGPGYQGWSHWHNGQTTGSFQTPWLNNGKPFYWGY